MTSTLRDLLHAARLTHICAEIEQAALPSIRLRLHPVDETHLKPGTTKFGGSPDLPQELVWPQHNGAPLPFIAQIDLSDVDPYDTQRLLPDTGRLYFFFDEEAFFNTWPRKQALWSVLYDPNSSSPLQRTNMLESPITRYRPCIVTYSVEMTLPDYSQYDDGSILRLGLSEPLTDKEEKAYYDVQSQLAGRTGSKYHMPIHRLLGHPDPVQWDMHRDLGGMPTDWQLLFQVDSDGVPDMDWGDTGRIYYWIRTRDLQQRDFSQVQLILQCT